MSNINNNIVTLGYLKGFTKGVLKLNKNITNTSDDIIVTYEDIINGVYYPYFKDSTNPKQIISGLCLKKREVISNIVYKENLSIIFPKLSNIEITCDNVELSPCGDKKELITYGNFNIMQRFYNGEELIKKLNCEINPILRKQDKEDELFILDGHYCLIGENLSNEDRKIMITASYGYKNVIKNSSIELIQKSNELTDWIFSHNVTTSLEISGDNTLISKDGGKCIITVKRHYTSFHYQLDSCGNKVSEKANPYNVEDISKICQYSSTNNSIFNRSVNVISVDKQPIGGDKRHCIINAKYDDCEASLTISQEEGSESHYTYTLLFNDESTFNVKTLNNSIKTSFIIKLISNKNMIVENEIYSTIPSYDLNFVKYDKWYDIDIIGIDEDGFINVKFNILNNNESKISDRETEVEIYNANDIDNRIKLLIRQPKNKCLKTEYDLLMEGERYFTYDTIKRSKIALKPFKIEHYEDGTIVESNEIPNDYKIVLKGKSSDDSVLKSGNLIKVDFNGNHEMKPKYFDIEVNYDVTLSCSAYINDNNGFRVTDIKCLNILLKGNEIIEYKYEFYPLFKYNELNEDNIITFEYDGLNEQCINIISNEYKIINNEETFKCFKNIKYIGNTDNFNIEIKHDNNIYIKPKEINETNDIITSIIKFVQEDSNNEIVINLVQEGKPSQIYKDIELTVNVHKENVEDDLWFEMKSNLIITDIDTNEIIYELPLSKWWLCPDSNVDSLYNGIIKLGINKLYNFNINETNVVKYINDKEIINVKLNETYLIEEDDEGIDLIIEI